MQPWVEAIAQLQCAGLSTGQNQQRVLCHAKPEVLAQALSIANQVGLFANINAQANFDKIVSSTDIGALVSYLLRANATSLFTDQNKQIVFDAIMHHRTPSLLITALSLVDYVGLMAQENARRNCNAIVAHQHLYPLCMALNTAIENGLLAGGHAQANFAAIMSHPYPDFFAQVLLGFARNGVFVGVAAQANFEFIIHVISSKPLIHALHGLTNYLLSQNRPISTPLGAQNIQSAMNCIEGRTVECTLKHLGNPGIAQQEIIQHIRLLIQTLSTPTRPNGFFATPPPENSRLDLAVHPSP